MATPKARFGIMEKRARVHRREERRDERLVPSKSPRLDINNDDDHDDKEDYFASDVNDGEFVSWCDGDHVCCKD